VYRSLAEVVLGFSDAARTAEVPFVSGNVSLYNETSGQGILPTPLLVAFGSAPQNAIPGTWGEKAIAEGSPIFLVGYGPLRLLPFLAAAYGAEFLRSKAKEAGERAAHIPLATLYEGEARFRTELPRLYADASLRQGIFAARAVREGGAIGVLLEMAAASQSGFTLDVRAQTPEDHLALLFGEGGYGVFVVGREFADTFLTRVREAGLHGFSLGEVRREDVGGAGIRLTSAEIAAWFAHALAPLGLSSLRVFRGGKATFQEDIANPMGEEETP